MIKPAQSGSELVRDIAATPAAPRRFDFWWLGQSGFLIQWNGHRMVFDPYLSDSLTRKYDGTDKAHVRMTEQVVEPGALVGITFATSSHNHTDHLDGETLAALAGANPDLHLVLPEANIDFAVDRLGSSFAGRCTGLDAGTAANVGAFRITGIPAAHNEVSTDDRGRHHFLGFVLSFGGFSVYHSGDTLWHDSLVGALTEHPPPDVAFLPINGNKPERRVAGNLNGTEAAALARAINAGLAVPHHFEMFAFNTEKPDEFEESCARLNQRYKTLRCGERCTIEA